MTEHFHAVLWMDHKDAKVFHFNAVEAESAAVHTHLTGRHLQHKANVPGSGHKGVDKEYFGRIAAELQHSGAILLTGPGIAKTEFKHYLAEHHPALDKRISAVETLDHPSEGELLALARRFFKADDRLHTQAG